MRKRVIVVEDEPITRMDISEMLLMEGYDVVGSASDGLDAIRLYEELNPDVVLMDIKMGILDGLNASKIILEKDKTSCIIMLTAYNTKEFIEESKEIGVAGYVVKPVEEKNLIPTIEMALARNEEMKKMKEKVEAVNQKLKERKYIEKAKGILIDKNNMKEEEAYKAMQKLSMDKRISLLDIAKIIILNAEGLSYEY